MPEENIRRLRTVYESWAEGDFRSGRELFADDVHFAPGSPGDEPVTGIEAVAKQMRHFLSDWRDFRVVGEDFEHLSDDPAAEVILVTERQYGTGRGSGLSLDASFYAVWTFRDGLVTNVHWHTDRSEALEAARLSQ